MKFARDMAPVTSVATLWRSSLVCAWAGLCCRFCSSFLASGASSSPTIRCVSVFRVPLLTRIRSLSDDYAGSRYLHWLWPRLCARLLWTGLPRTVLSSTQVAMTLVDPDVCLWSYLGKLRTIRSNLCDIRIISDVFNCRVWFVWLSVVLYDSEAGNL